MQIGLKTNGLLTSGKIKTANTLFPHSQGPPAEQKRCKKFEVPASVVTNELPCETTVVR